MTNQEDSEIIIDSSWRYIAIKAGIKCPPFTWFTDNGWRVINGLILIAPHISIPSEFLGGKYNFANELDRKRFERFTNWCESLEEGKDFVKIRG